MRRLHIDRSQKHIEIFVYRMDYVPFVSLKILCIEYILFDRSMFQRLKMFSRCNSLNSKLESQIFIHIVIRPVFLRFCGVLWFVCGKRALRSNFAFLLLKKKEQTLLFILFINIR